MRSQLVNEEYNLANCERIFPGLNMANRPPVKASEYSLGGFTTQGTNIFFTNGSEDPWQWATQRVDRAEFN